MTSMATSPNMSEVQMWRSMKVEIVLQNSRITFASLDFAVVLVEALLKHLAREILIII